MRRPIATSLRIAILAVLLAFASNLAVIGFVYLRVEGNAEETVRVRAWEQAVGLERVAKTGGYAALTGAIDGMLDADDPQLAVGLFDARGRRILGNIAAIGPEGWNRSSYRVGTLRLAGQAQPVEAGYVVQSFGATMLVSGRTFGEAYALERTLERSLLLALALALILGPIYGWVLARYVGTRVDAIRRVVDAAARGDLAARVPSAGEGDAFDALAGRINHMLGRIEALMGELRLLTDSLAHDLRSPVSRLRVRIERAMTVGDEAERDRLLAGVIPEADALMRILQTVIEIGRTEAGVGREQFAAVDLAEMVAELCEMYEPIAEEAELALLLDAAPGLPPFRGHGQLLAQALSNLLDNALRHGAGPLTLFARVEEGVLLLGVADRGRGIQSAERDEARRRFGRLDAARTSTGAGLGLSLVDAVARLHGGHLVLADNAPGLRAMLRLPMEPNAEHA